MKHITKKSWAVRCLLAIVFAAPLFAFTLPFRGGDVFEIHVGKKQVVFQGLHDKDVKTVDLSSAASSDIVKVNFNHCGKVGTNRTLSLKANNQVIKQWKFDNAKDKYDEAVFMKIAVKDIQALLKEQKGKQLALYYTSDLLKDGKTLANITQGNVSASSR